MKEVRLSVLVVESDPERIQLFEEAFGEMEELRFATPWLPVCSREYALDWHECLDMAGAQRFDAVLVNLEAIAEPRARSIQSLRAAAGPAAAVVAAATPQTESIALALLRVGVQDYIMAGELDCAPLARLLRSSVERCRLQWSCQSVSMVDDLTGLYNAHGVEVLAGRDARLARSLGLQTWKVNVDLSPGSSDDADLLRLDAAAQLSELAAPRGFIAGRVGLDAFVVMGLARGEAEAEDAARRVATAVRGATVACATGLTGC
jgi:DNA-binding NarL/FixJ family response regulator